MNKKFTKTTNQGPKYDSRREQNILIEKMDSGLKTVAEQHESIVKRLDGLESQVGYVKMAVLQNYGDIKIVKDDIKILKNGQERIEQKLDVVVSNHEQRISALETKIT